MFIKVQKERATEITTDVLLKSNLKALYYNIQN